MSPARCLDERFLRATAARNLLICILPCPSLSPGMIRLVPRSEWMVFSTPTRTKVFPTRMQATWPSHLQGEVADWRTFPLTSLSKLVSRAMKPDACLEALLMRPSIWDMHPPWPGEFDAAPLREYPWLDCSTRVRTIPRQRERSTVQPRSVLLGHCHNSGIRPGTVVIVPSARLASKSYLDLGILRRRMSSSVKLLDRMRTSKAVPLSVPPATS